jgi:DNA-binding response OmpR family regulator
MRILLVEDQPKLARLLRKGLLEEGVTADLAATGLDGVWLATEHPYDVVVLDVMLPDVDGLEVCRRIRARHNVPIIMLTAKAEEIDKVLGLELGADDYITKPFSLREFRSRVRAALRRAGMSSANGESADDEPLEAHELRIDPAKRQVTVRGEPIATTFVEFEILSVLARHPGRVYTRDMLLDRLWGDSAFRDQRTIDVHIRHLREKLERDPKTPEFLLTVRGVGYRFRDE